MEVAAVKPFAWIDFQGKVQMGAPSLLSSDGVFHVEKVSDVLMYRRQLRRVEAKEQAGERVQHRNAVEKENDNNRTIEPDRGMPSASRTQQAIDVTMVRMAKLKQQLDVSQLMIQHATTAEDKKIWLDKMKHYAQQICDENPLTCYHLLR